MNERQPYLLIAGALALVPVHAQLGTGWTAYKPEIRVHLDDVQGLQTYAWKPYIAACSSNDPCADYRYDSATDTETFRLLDGRTNRSEIRLHNDYRTGSRQFEGYVTFSAPLNDESLMQIFGSTEGATQLMIRGFAAGGGSLRGTGDLATGCYGKELRVNVIHHQEDVGNRIRIYVNGALRADFADNERVSNYHKYGCYGTLRTPEAVVRWRAVRHFRDGQPPSSNISTLAGAAERGLLLAQAGNSLRIRLGREQTGTVDLLSVSGRRLFTRKLAGRSEYSVSLPLADGGVYLVLVNGAGARIARKAVMDGFSLRIQDAPAQ